MNSFNSLAVNLEKTSQHNDAIKIKLLSASNSIKYASKKITSLVHSDILSKQFSTEPHQFFDVATAAIDSGYAQIYETLLPALEILLYVRIHQIEENLLFNVGGALLLALVAQYLFFGIYYATINNIH